MKAFILTIEPQLRAKKLFSELEKLGIRSTIINGFDGRKLSPDLVVPNKLSKKSFKIMERELTRAEIACALGHRMMYQEFLRTKEEWGLFLEDDAFPSKNISFHKTELKVINSPVIVNLRGIKNLIQSHMRMPCLLISADNFSKSDNQFIVYKTLGQITGAYAYLMNRSAAEVALAQIGPIDSTADWPYSWRNRIAFFIPEDPQFDVSLLESVIDEGRQVALKNAADAKSHKNIPVSIQRCHTLLGIIGISSLFAYVEKRTFRQHYKEKVLVPFLLRRINNQGWK